MKVLLINVYNYRKGGSETVYFNTCKLLEEAGHEVVRFTLKWDNNEPSATSDFFPESKETRRGPLKPLANIVNYFYHFEAERKLSELIDIHRPDIAHIHLIWGQLTPSVLVALRRKGIPVVATAHDYRIVCPAYAFRDGKGNVCERCEGHSFYHCLTQRCSKGKLSESAVMAAEQYFRNAFFNPAHMIDGMIYVSNFARDKHLQYMPALAKLPSISLYNTTPADGLNPIKRAADFANGGYFLTFGRLSAEKGINTLVGAFAALPHLKLKVAGTGPLEAEIRNRVGSEGLSNIELLGYKSGRELTELVRGARFAVVPSEWYENNPMTVVESYSNGVPVIGARIGGIPEIVEEGKTGFMFNPGDISDLTRALTEAASLAPDDMERMSKACIDFSEANFSPSRHLERLVDFYRRVIDGKKNS